MVVDRAVSSLKQVKNITFRSGSVRIKEQIGGQNVNDLFSFRLNGRSSVNFSLNGNANLQVLNGKGQSLQVAKPSSKLQGKALSTINTRLETGTYYVRVASAAKHSNSYTLSGTTSLLQPLSSLDKPGLDPKATIAYPQTLNRAQSSTTGIDDGSVIDIMIAYTSDARAAEGSTSAINRTIQSAIDEVNQGYANSGIIQRLRLVHTAEVSYTESGNSDTDLARLQNKSDGYLDEVHAMRDTYGADIVSLFVKNSESGGNSYTMGQVRHEFESYAFNVVRLNNVKTRFSLGHEIGHNLGAAHDRAHVDTDGALSYAHGYITPSGVGDVMAYSSDRRNYYASPNLTINGETLGKAGEADVVGAFNQVRFTAANWRKSMVA